jgi:hypothetical protein
LNFAPKVTKNLKIKKKGLNGFQILCLSKEQNITQNLTCYTSQVKSMSLIASQLVGNSTNLQVKTTEENALLINVRDENEYPIPLSPNFLKVSFLLNLTIFQNLFSLAENSSKIWIYAAYNSKYQTNSISKLINDYDESFISYIDIGKSGLWINFSNFKEFDHILDNKSFFKFTQMSIASFAFESVFCLLNAFCCILFYFQQPMKSRGIITILASIMLFIGSFENIYLYFDLEYYYIGCYTLTLVRIPTQCSIFLLVLFSFFRFIIISSLNSRKNQIYLLKKNGNDVKVKHIFKILKFLNHPIAISFIWFFSFIFLVGIYGITLIAIKCESPVFDRIRVIFNIVYYVFLILSATLLILIDVIIHFRIIFFQKWGIFHFFGREDKYKFRIQTWLLLLSLGGPYIILTIIRIGFGYAAKPVPFFLLIFFNSFLLYFVYIFIVGVIVVLSFFTLIQKIFSCIIRKLKKEEIESKDDFVSKLNNPEIFDLFYNFARLEWATENALCYQDIQQFKKNPTLEKAQSIYSMYCNGRLSELEINVTVSTCTDVYKIIQSGNVNPEMFKIIEDQIVSNMRDTFSRFRWTIEYKSYQQSKQFQKESYE